ncbi:MAG TPA: MFS transporter [Solirubrobacteraceae bacterium]|jgi:MFS family permease|nr:MFS transporter [Solirubrobacteraceae bacterium]
MTTVLSHPHTLSTDRENSRALRQPPSSVHGVAFWLAAAAFLVNMGMSAVPTPLYPLYQERDGLSNLMITIIYAVYAIGVIASLFLAGHLSDSYGRRRVFIPALLVNAISGVVFIFEPSLAGLLIARVISGVSVGLTTATATSYLAELHAKHRPDASTRRADVVATASNLGGIGFGPLIAGFLVQLLPIPLRLSYIVFAAVLVVLAMALTLAPETVARVEPRPRYRPQRVAVPAAARATFFAATAAGLAAFAVFGVFNSLVPSFLAGTLHNSSHIVAGAAAFAPFAAAAVAQIVQAQTDSLTLLRRAVPVVALGLAMFAGGMWASSLALFLAGGVVTGAGAGMIFKGALVVTVSKAPAGARAEVLAGYFLGAYVGLSVPVIGLGLATNYWAARDVMLVFVVLAAAAIAVSVRAVVRLNSARPAV